MPDRAIPRSDSDFSIFWRRHVPARAAGHAVPLDGDRVECGRYRGPGIKTVVDYLGGTTFSRSGVTTC